MDLTVVIFVLVYLAMALGHLPGLKVDRTGAALIGAMLLMITGKISPAAAWQSVDFNTIGLLFGLMVVSAAFVAGGFYDWVAAKLGEAPVGPRALLGLMVAVSAGLSALLTNDVVMVAMIPVLCAITIARGLNPIPFLLGLTFAANVGSTATLIGSPRNMILAETLHMSFTDFSRITLLPSVVSLVLVWLVLAAFYRNRWQLAAAEDTAATPTANMAAAAVDSAADVPVDNTVEASAASAVDGSTDGTAKMPADGSTQAAVVEAAAAAPAPQIKPFNKTETLKASVVTLAVIAAFVFTDWPHVLIALAAASLLLLNRKISSHTLLDDVNGNLLLLLMGLFVVNAAMASTGLPHQVMTTLHNIGVELHSPLQALLISAVVSDG